MGERVGVRGTGKVLNALAVLTAPLTPTLSPLRVEREFGGARINTHPAPPQRRVAPKARLRRDAALWGSEQPHPLIPRPPPRQHEDAEPQRGNTHQHRRIGRRHAHIPR